ncbi:50S ribosomal protein L21 [Blattabacterium cuenoti]|nr:50S ribosomal protein L21 [Blattabacterium cuenoti]
MNYAIVNIQGIQFKLFENKYFYVPRLSEKLGDKISLDKVFLFVREKEIFLGNPFLNNVTVEIEVLEHLKGKKIVIFKKKRRKGYKVKKGFRPYFTKIKVISFIKKI